MQMTEISCDVAVIGAGTAGLAAERTARRNGARTLLIDEQFAGTTCTNVGCMPSKLLIAAGNAAHAARQASVFGIEAKPAVDGRAVMERLRRERDAFIAGVRQSFERLPEGVRRKARARFVGPTRLDLGNDTFVTAKAIVVATGARPSIPDFLDGLDDALLTNETIFDLADLPASVGVVGGGPIGLELAQGLARLGVRVALFDEGHALAALDDDEAAQSLHAALSVEFSIHLGVKLAARRQGEGIRLYWQTDSEDADGKGEADFERVLVAAGRPPRLDGLNLDASGLDLDEHGAPRVDPATMQCGDAPIFLAGDADHARPVLHEAQAEGAIAGRNAATFPRVEPGRRMAPLSIMFTEPPMAIAGSLPKPGAEGTVSGSASYQDQGRAKVFATNAGFVRIHADATDGRLLGALIVGPAAEHSGHLLAWAIQQGLTATAVLDLPFYHPTYEEGLQPALRTICRAVHAAIPTDRDDGISPGA